MRKLFVLLLLCSYFFSTTELNQLLKIPVLVSHFLDHRSSDNMDVWEYISHHYGGHEKDADWDTDMKLPFMQHSDFLQLVVITPKNILAFLPSQQYSYFEKEFSCYKDRYIPSSSLSAIWQPPKFC